MGRHKKTPIINRSFWVYAKNDEMAERWKQQAKKRGMPLSGFLTEVIESRILDETTTAPRKTMEKQLHELQEENTRLQTMNVELSKKVDMLDNLTDRQQEELRQLRNRGFLEIEGARTFEPKLIELFREHHHLKDTEIPGLLNINPRDIEQSKALNRQIDTLFDYGLIKRLKGGYQWLG